MDVCHHNSFYIYHMHMFTKIILSDKARCVDGLMGMNVKVRLCKYSTTNLQHGRDNEVEQKPQSPLL